ncbi:MAG TPA: pyridoxal phosphate-dependent aminotransferase [Bacteroidia bacterium]|nr:pyridoxal phosphate-dependent aminotransferase [Bacteroidia bacterium]
MESTIAKPKPAEVKVSEMAEHLVGSEILKIAAEVNEKIRKGEKIYNFTVGDFDSTIFPIPEELKADIIEAYQNNQTNYPPSDGVLALRQAVSRYLYATSELQYSPSDEIIIAGGARPIIYSAYRALVDPGDYVLYPVPSWNNNHYISLTAAKGIEVEASAANNFMPTAEDIKPHIEKVTLISLCSPQNPTGTMFTHKGLHDICQLILEENYRRGAIGKKPVYLLYDQVYCQLTFAGTTHYNPVTMFPEMRNYTVFVDGISKFLASTGVRVGWSMGNKQIIDKMKSIIGHVGAWAPKAEQVAVAKYLDNIPHVTRFLSRFKENIYERLEEFYKGFTQLKEEGFHVNVIKPQGAIYLTVNFELAGMKTATGVTLTDSESVMRYLLDVANVAIVPFYAFGGSVESPWFRLSVGTSKVNEIPDVINRLRKALQQLKS